MCFFQGCVGKVWKLFIYSIRKNQFETQVFRWNCRKSVKAVNKQHSYFVFGCVGKMWKLFIYSLNCKLSKTWVSFCNENAKKPFFAQRQISLSKNRLFRFHFDFQNKNKKIMANLGEFFWMLFIYSFHTFPTIPFKNTSFVLSFDESCF
jgi:hypothetical protein